MDRWELTRTKNGRRSPGFSAVAGTTTFDLNPETFPPARHEHNAASSLRQRIDDRCVAGVRRANAMAEIAARLVRGGHGAHLEGLLLQAGRVREGKPFDHVLAAVCDICGGGGFRKDGVLAGLTRPQLYERSASRQPIRVHDLRAAFATRGLANGHSETRVADRTGHETSGRRTNMRRYRAPRRNPRIAV